MEKGMRTWTGTMRKVWQGVLVTGFLAVVCGCGTGSRLAKVPLLAPDGLCENDLLFVVNSQGNAITQVTRGYGGLQIDHVGVVTSADDGSDSRPQEFAVYESYPGSGVGETPLSRFMARNRESGGQTRVLVGRVKGTFVNTMWQYEGLPYDSLYVDTDEAIYCSELVQKSFCDLQGKPVFNTIPMTYRNASGEIPLYWREFYGRHGMAVPEGEPGSNPGQLSRSHRVRIVGWLVY